MEVERQRDGAWHFILGTFGKIVVGVVVAAVVSLCVTVIAMARNQAVMNLQLAIISKQLDSMPAFRQQYSSDMADLKVKVERNTRDIHEMQGWWDKR